MRRDKQPDAGHEITPDAERRIALETARRAITRGWTVERAAQAYGVEPHELLLDFNPSST
jgi:hypothetical protein